MNKKYIDKLYSSAVEGTCQLLLAQFWRSYAYIWANEFVGKN